MNQLVKLFMNSASLLERNKSVTPQIIVKRWRKAKDVDIPLPGKGQAFRRMIHYPEEYTIKPLEVTNLGGRDPVSGKHIVVVAANLGNSRLNNIDATQICRYNDDIMII